MVEELRNIHRELLPNGLTVMPRSAIPTFLASLPVGKIWGIGSATTIHLRKLGVTTASELAGKSRAWVAEYCVPRSFSVCVIPAVADVNAPFVPVSVVARLLIWLP